MIRAILCKKKDILGSVGFILGLWYEEFERIWNIQSIDFTSPVWQKVSGEVGTASGERPKR